MKQTDLSKYNNTIDIIWTNFNQFVKLNELIINDSWIGTNTNASPVHNTIFQLRDYNFVINAAPSYNLTHPWFIDIFNFPQITVLEIQKSSTSNGNVELGNFYNVPNLVELRLNNFDKDLNVLTYIQTIPKLKKFSLIKCNYITSTKIVDIREYCVKQKIQFTVE